MKNENNYEKALTEVEAVVNCLVDEDYNKIPKETLEFIRENKDKSYEYDYDLELSYEDWDFMPETKALLYILYNKYFATEEEKEYFKQKEKIERLILLTKNLH